MTDVFISFKNTYGGEPTRDSVIAKQLYDIMKAHGFDVFMSNSTLSECGNSNFKEEIDRALDECKYLVLVGTKEEYINSPWVKYEWDIFYQDIISGNKPDADIFCVFDSFEGTVPRTLRYKETFAATQDGFSALMAFLSSKTGRAKRSDVFVCKNCGKIFTAANMRGCKYHPKKPLPITERGFGGEIREFLLFPCCNKKIEKNNPHTGGCVFGFHKHL
ncbi:MAG: toll/interleukin-1 receptor domain-containing protein [Clostridia bacterium]|nr:toll/interleukin-1 receptor domain-containing protein [Clostridia bacterium]